MSIPAARVSCLLIERWDFRENLLKRKKPLSNGLSFVLPGTVPIMGFPAAKTEPFPKPEGLHCLSLRRAESGVRS